MHSELITVIAVTLFLPLLVLVSDYMFRAEANMTTVMRMAGPDLCLLGLGAVASVFIDPHVIKALQPVPTMVPGITVIFIIFILRGFCFRASKSQTNGAAFATAAAGVASLTVIASILVYSYWRV